MERPTIAPGFVAEARDCLRRQGIDPAPILARAGLDGRASAPVTPRAYGALWRLTAAALDDEFFGLAARPMRPGSFALMCHATLGSPTLETALRRAILFLSVVLDDPRGELQLRGGTATVLLHDSGAPRSAFAYRTYWLILMGLACWLIGRRIALRELQFTCPLPDRGSAEYRQFFGVPVQFGCAESRLGFDAAYLRLPVTRDAAALRRFLRSAPDNILVRYRHDRDTSTRLHKALGALPAGDWPGFDGLARSFGMAPATLRRRLRAEGRSFAEIKDEIRAARARALLHDGTLSVAEIAAELGYSEPSAFYRAFRKWTGQRPGALRQ